MADFQTSIELKAVTGQLNAKLAAVDKNLKKVSTQVQKTQGSFKKMGSKVSGTLDKLNRKLKEHRMAIAGIGLAVGALAMKGVSDFKKFEDGIAQIGTLGVKNLGSVKDELNSVRKEFGITGDEATKGYYDIISAGATSSAQALDRLTAATKLAKAGNTDLAGAVDVVTSGINTFGDNGETATSITDKLFLSVKFGKTTVEELGAKFGDLAPVMDVAGLGMSDYAASMAAVTAGGIKTNQATTGLKALLSNMIKPSEKAKKAAKELGIEFNTAALKSKGLVAVMQDIKTATKGDATQLGRFFDSIEAINTASVLTSDVGLPALIRNMNAMGDAAGTTATALEVVKKSASFRFNLFNQSLAVMSENIGAAVIPALLDMAAALGPVVDFFSGLIAMYPGIIKVGVAVTALAASLAFLGGPVTVAIALIGTGFVTLMKHFDAFREGGMDALYKMHLSWKNFWAGFVGDGIFGTFTGLMKGFADGFSNAWSNLVPDEYMDIGDFIIISTKELWTGIESDLKILWKDITEWFSKVDWDDIAVSLGKGIREAFSSVSNFAVVISESISDLFTDIDTGELKIDWSKIFEGLKSAVEGVSRFITKTLAAALDIDPSSVIKSFENLGLKAKEAIRGLVKYVKSISWKDLFGEIGEVLVNVGKWFYKLYDDVIGHSYFPDLINGIKEWTDKLGDWFVTPIKDAVSSVSGFFESLDVSVLQKVISVFENFKKSVSSETVHKKIKVTVEGQEILGDIKKDVGGIGNIAIKVVGEENLDSLKTNLKTVAIAAAGIWAGPKMLRALSTFKTSFSSFTDVGGKQGLMNRIIFGAEGTARNYVHQVKKAKKGIASIADAKTLQGGGKLTRGSQESRRAFFLRKMSAKKLATVESNILAAKLDKHTSMVKKHATKVADSVKGRGIFSRALFGKGNADTLRAKVKGLTRNISTGFINMSKKAGVAYTSTVGHATKAAKKINKLGIASRLRGGVLGGMMLGQQGLAGLTRRLKSGEALVKGSILKLKAAALVSYVKGGIFGSVIWGKGGLVVMKEKLATAFAAVTASLTKLNLVKFGKAGLIAGAIWGVSAAASEASGGFSLQKAIDGLNFESIKTKASSLLSQYGTEGLMMWMMFGAPGLGALASLGSNMWKMMKGGIVALSVKIGAILAPLGASILSGPVGWVALGVAAVGALTYAYWDDIKPFFVKMWEDLKSWFSSLTFDWNPFDFSDTVIVQPETLSKTEKDNLEIPDNLRIPGEGFATGGHISGAGTGTSDDIPAMLSNGEFVINAKATQKNRSLLEAINNGGKLKKFSGGGDAGDVSSLKFSGEGKGSFDLKSTLKEFLSIVDETNPAVARVVDRLRDLDERTDALTKTAVLEDKWAKEVIKDMMELHPAKQEELRLAKEVAASEEAKISAAEDLVKRWDNIGREITQPFKDLVNSAGSLRGIWDGMGGAVKQGISNMFMKMANTYLETALKPLEEGFTNWVVEMDSGSFSDLFDSVIGLFDGMGGGEGGWMDSIGGMFSSDDSVGGGIMDSISTFFAANGGIVPQYLATGGVVGDSGPKGSDTIPAWLTPGEVVLNAGQQENIAGAMGGAGGGSTYNTYNLEVTGNVDQRAIDQIKNVIQSSPNEVNNAASTGKRNASGLRRR